MSPRCTVAPRSVRVEAEASLRARPRTVCPWARSSVVTAWPMKPDAPVTKTCIVSGALLEGSMGFCQSEVNVDSVGWREACGLVIILSCLRVVEFTDG